MKEHSLITLICVGGYALGCLAVGLWSMRRTRNARDYFMAGRRLGVLVTALALFSTMLSGFAFVGGPGLVYRMGMSSVWIVISAAIAHTLAIFLVAKRLRLIAEARDTLSLPAAIEARYGSRTSRGLAALVIILGALGYLAAQVLAMARVLRSLVLESEWLASFSLETAVLISSTFLILYCVAGGILASVYTDVFQGAVMVIGALLVFITAAQSFEGGFEGMSRAIHADDAGAIGPWGVLGVLGALSWYFVFGLGICGQPHVVTKAMMIRKPESLRHVLVITILSGSIAGLLWIAVGVAMRAQVVSGQMPELAMADEAAPVFLQSFAHPWVAGLVFAAIFSAIMSTGDGFLNIGAAALVHDLPAALRGRERNRAVSAGSKELLHARLATVALGVIATTLALYWDDLLAFLGIFGWSAFAGALVPVVGIGFNWKRATPFAANLTIVFSLTATMAVELFDWKLPAGINAGAVILILSLILFLVASRLGRARPLAADIAAAMEV